MMVGCVYTSCEVSVISLNVMTSGNTSVVASVYVVNLYSTPLPAPASTCAAEVVTPAPIVDLGSVFPEVVVTTRSGISKDCEELVISFPVLVVIISMFVLVVSALFEELRDEVDGG